MYICIYVYICMYVCVCVCVCVQKPVMEELQNVHVCALSVQTTFIYTPLYVNIDYKFN
jgi:hypothetical protein